MGAQRKLSFLARVFIAAIVLDGAAAIVFRAADVPRWSETDVLAFAALLAAIVLAEQFQIPFRSRSETQNFALTDSVWAAALLLVRPSVLTLALAAGVLVGQAFRGWASYKIAFNVGQFLVAITAAQLVYDRLSGTATALEPSAWLAAVVAMWVFFVINTTAIALVIALAERAPLVSVLRRPLGLRVVLWCGNVTLGILAAVIVRAEPAALPLLLVPLVMSYTAYRGWSRSMRELESAFDRERRFISEASHELRTPITICRGQLEVLAPDSDPETVRSTVSIVVDELARMGRIVDDLITLASSEQPKFVQTESVSLDRFVRDIAVKASPFLNGRLRIAPIPDRAVVRADPQRLTQALVNLLHNVAVHTPARTKVELRVVADPPYYRFVVSDDGNGLAEGEEEAVFQPFYRGDVSRPGTGLGLPIVRAIAEAHGGSAGAESRNGGGATFWIRVPG